MGFFSFFSKEKKETLDKGLSKTKESVFGKIARAVAGKSNVDDEVLDNLEEVLITSDVGVETTLKIIERIEKRAADEKYMNAQELNMILRDEIAALLTENNSDDVDDFETPITKKPYVIMVVGVNGVGKTTTIGKLAYQFKKAGKSVYLGAADTFRAAAVEQLVIWGERVGVPVIKQKMGADPASVAFDTLSSAVANNADVVIIDTAGRLHNKVGLMNELTKIKNVMKKVVPDAPNEVLLVLDGSTGQNAFEQAKQFTLATEVTAMAVTKLDGTAKGGVVIGISDQFKIPVKTGEISGMTRRSDLLRHHQNRIAVAVVADSFYHLKMSGGLSFVPHRLTASAVKPGRSGSQRALQRLFIHVRQHENLFCLRILNDSGYQPPAVVTDLAQNFFIHFILRPAFPAPFFFDRAFFTRRSKNLLQQKQTDGSMPSADCP